jgi:L,D-transpeptidase-like protein
LIHLIFSRPEQKIKLFDNSGTWIQTYTGEGDAWGYSDDDVYGFDSWCPPGHFILGTPQIFEAPIASEGFGQIPVSDLDATTLGTLVSAGKAVANGVVVTIGGLELEIGQLDKYNRSAIMVHGGGSNAPSPLADFQTLCKTDGCTRMYNQEWQKLATWIQDNSTNETVVFSITGDPVILPC